MQRLLNGQTIDEVAIERIRAHADAAVARCPEGFLVGFSGGKDSVVLLDLVERSGVKFEASYSLTTVDPPELVQFVKTFKNVRIDRPPINMFDLIRKKGMPPRRCVRYCCEVMKETAGRPGQVILTGVRWEESVRRGKRRMIEPCYRGNKTRSFLHPIIDWSETDVWQYIRDRGLRYCKLYDEGWRRLGCVLCPMVRDVEKHIARWPKIAALWERAIKDTFKPDQTKRTAFKTPEEYWRWWLDRDAPGMDDNAGDLFGASDMEW